MAPQKTYSLDDLSNLTGYDKRAIRNFIEKGLLRGPDSMGRYARYSESHLSRLLAIKWLRENQGMSTGKVRTSLLTMSQEEIDIIVAKVNSVDKTTDKPKSSALDYLESISLQTGSSSNVESFTDYDTLGTTPLDLLQQKLSRILKNTPVRKQSKEESWLRISITPDIELSVRGFHSEEEIARIKRICDYLREILLGGFEDDATK